MKWLLTKTLLKFCYAYIYLLYNSTWDSIYSFLITDVHTINYKFYNLALFFSLSSFTDKADCDLLSFIGFTL